MTNKARLFWSFGLLVTLIGDLSADAHAAESIVKKHFKAIIGSCLHQDKPQPIWQAINEEQGDLFVLLGDNIYGDTEDMSVLKQKYQKQWRQPGMQTMMASMPLIGIWDDHDFGENDAGAEYPQKEASRQILLDQFNEPKDSIRRTRPDGIYTSYIYGEAPHRVQVILPDLRWNRTSLNHVSRLDYIMNKKPDGLGPYIPHTDNTASMLGEAQWKWLEQQLEQPADVRILGSSLQLLSEFTGWESWANFPKERERLLTMIANKNITNLVFISGDTHWGELSKVSNQGHDLYELTASGLTEEWKNVSPNQHRVGASYAKPNYGVVEVNWPTTEAENVEVSLTLKDVQGATVLTKTLALGER